MIQQQRSASNTYIRKLHVIMLSPRGKAKGSYIVVDTAHALFTSGVLAYGALTRGVNIYTSRCSGNQETVLAVVRMLLHTSTDSYTHGNCAVRSGRWYIFSDTDNKKLLGSFHDRITSAFRHQCNATY